MKKYINGLTQKEKIVIAFIVGWTFIHLIFLLISDGNKRVFWPFDDEPILVSDYDKIEFFVYVFTPIIIFSTYLLLTKKTYIDDSVNQKPSFDFKSFYIKHKIFIIFYSLWLILQITFLFISNCTWNKFPDYPQLFYPFSGYPNYFYELEKNPYTLLIYTYSYSEFFVYSSLPILFRLIMIKLYDKKVKTDSVLSNDIKINTTKKGLKKTLIITGIFFVFIISIILGSHYINLNLFQKYYFEKQDSLTTDIDSTTILKKIISEERVSTFEALEKFGEIVKGEVFCKHIPILTLGSTADLENDDNSNFYKRYNKKSREVLAEYYNESLTIVTKEIINYDISDTIETFRNIYYNNGELKEKWKIFETKKIDSLFIYSNEGKLTDKFIYKYDKKGNATELTYFFSKTPFSKHTYSYDSLGNEESDWNFLWNETKGEWDYEKHIEYEYNKDKKIVTKTINEGSDNSGESFLIIQYKWDTFGNCIEEKRNYKNNTKDITITFKYTYDKNKNWIQCIEFHNSIPFSIKIRELKYYN